MQVTGKLHMVMTFSQMLVGNLHCSGNIRHDKDKKNIVKACNKNLGGGLMHKIIG